MEIFDSIESWWKFLY